MYDDARGTGFLDLRGPKNEKIKGMKTIFAFLAQVLFAISLSLTSILA